MDEQPLSLYELNALVKRGIRACMPDTYWVRAELSDVRSNYSGHCYVEFVQKDPRGNSLIAKARGTVWSTVYHLLKPYFEEETGQPFAAGIKVLVKVTVEFHELYGYSLTVQDIDPAYTLGDMARRRREILKQLEEEGVLTLNKELEIPLLAQRVAVISSATAAGYGDFCDQLEHNPFGFVFYPRLFPAVMQGDRVEQSVIAALDAINACRDDWDVVVVIRGGGATSDLSGFDTYELATNCAQFPLPIITGIGHERDDTVLDCVAHTRVKTPTAVAEFLVNHLHDTAEVLEEYASSVRQIASTRMEREKNVLNRMGERIPMQIRIRLKEETHRYYRLLEQLETGVQACLTREKYRQNMVKTRMNLAVRYCLAGKSYRLEAVQTRLETVVGNRMENETHRLRLLEQAVKAASPQHLLERGYSITLRNGRAVTDASVLKEGDELVTRFAQGEIKSMVTKKTE